MLHLSLIVLRLLSTAGFDAVAVSIHYQLLLRFPVTDTTPLFERALGSALTVQVRREADVQGVPGGWSVAVVRLGGGPEAFNLLYHSRAWHGSYPTDLFAWIHEDHYFPDERVLPVYDYPYELRLRCVDCVTAKTARGVEFISGRVEVGWRRTRRPARRGA
jgi:hypothetical protein